MTVPESTSVPHVEIGLGRGNRWRAVMQGDAFLIGRDSGVRIDRSNLVEGQQKSLPKIPDPGIPLAELLINIRPGDKLGTVLRDAVETLGQPDICIESNRRVGN